MAEAETTAADRNVEIWKIKKLIKSLEAARGYVFLPRDAMLVQYILSECVCLSACPSVRHKLMLY